MHQSQFSRPSSWIQACIYGRAYNALLISQYLHSTYDFSLSASDHPLNPNPGLLTSVYLQTCKKSNTYRASPIQYCYGTFRRELGSYPKNMPPILSHIIPLNSLDNYFVYRLQRLVSIEFHIQYLSIYSFAWQKIWEQQVLSISLKKLETSGQGGWIMKSL